MTLEKILHGARYAAKWPDKQVLRAHARFARHTNQDEQNLADRMKIYSDQHRNCGSLSYAIGFIIADAPTITPNEALSDTVQMVLYPTALPLAVAMIRYIIAPAEALAKSSKDNPQDGAVAIDEKRERNLRRGRKGRFVGLIGGTGAILLGAAGAITDPSPYELGMTLIGSSIALASSSLYFRDADPKMLDREPSRVAIAYHWVKEQIPSFHPSPRPEPVPVAEIAGPSYNA